MSDLQGCRAVVFDAYGTLFDVVAPARDLLGKRAEAVATLWRRKQLEYTWLRSLMGRHADFAQVTAEALDYALAASAIDDPQLRAELLAAYRRLPLYSDVPATLALLHAAEVRTAILSNGTPEMLRAVVAHAGLEVTVFPVLSIETVGVFKPHPKTYGVAAERLGLEPDRICFVSANGWDVAGAAVFGFAAVWLDRRNEAEDRLPGRPAARIPTLAELPALLSIAQ